MVHWSSSASAAPEGSGATPYDRFGYTTYVADVRKGNSITRPDKPRVPAGIKAKGALKAGERVKRVMLVVPTRDDAVALRPLVDEGKVDAVVYQGEALHDPNALGESRWVPWDETRNR